ncbi:MAG: hypothetical protein WA061_02025 [Microgenomates group bacterium]
MINQHARNQIINRNIPVDIEMVEFLTKKSEGIDTAFILGDGENLGDRCWIILIVRNYTAITIEYRRKTQSITKQSLKVNKISEYPCLFQ